MCAPFQAIMRLQTQLQTLTAAYTTAQDEVKSVTAREAAVIEERETGKAEIAELQGQVQQLQQREQERTRSHSQVHFRPLTLALQLSFCSGLQCTRTRICGHDPSRRHRRWLTLIGWLWHVVGFWLSCVCDLVFITSRWNNNSAHCFSNTNKKSHNCWHPINNTRRRFSNTLTRYAA
jgi:hypothetical protein